jgi:hypothetical protein
MPKRVASKERIIKSSRTAKAKKGLLQHPVRVEFSTSEKVSRDDLEPSFHYETSEESVISDLNNLEEHAKNILQDAGLDYEARHSGRLDYQLSDGKRGNYDAIIQEKRKDFEPAYFADEILFEILQLRKHIGKSDMFEALRSVFSIEKIRRDLFVKIYEHELAAGVAQRKVGKIHGRAKGSSGKGFALVTYLIELHVLGSKVKERREKKGAEAAEFILYKSGDGEIIDLDWEGITTYQCNKLEDNTITVQYTLEGEPEGKYHPINLTRTISEVMKKR